MPTLAEVRQADRIARGFTYDACRGRMVYLQEAADYFARALRNLRDSGLPEHTNSAAVDLDAVRSIVLDGLNQAHGMILNEADADRIAPDMFPLDLSEIGGK